MENLFSTHSAEETKKLAQEIVRELRPGTMLCLSGDLGAGKTTFAQGILESFGAEKPYTSPTFVIMKQYDLARAVHGILRIYHVDAYRVEEKALKNLGLEEWCADPSGLVLLEWPERVTSLIPPTAWHIRFGWQSATERVIRIKKENA